MENRNWFPTARTAARERHGGHPGGGGSGGEPAGAEAATETGTRAGDAQAAADAEDLRDAGRFERLVAAHAAALHGYLARRAPRAADDLLAEVWLRAFAGRAGYDPARGTVRVWLFGVARHVLAAHWRGDGGYGAGARADGTGGAVDGAADGLGAEPYADPWQAVDQRLDAAAVAPLIRRTLRDLPHVERELLLLVVWEQLTPAEAATVVGVPQGTARSRLHRARARLREALADAPAITGTTGART